MDRRIDIIIDTYLQKAHVASLYFERFKNDLRSLVLTRWQNRVSQA